MGNCELFRWSQKWAILYDDLGGRAKFPEVLNGLKAVQPETQENQFQRLAATAVGNVGSLQACYSTSGGCRSYCWIL